MMRNQELFGQPKGLWVLAGTELWDRISFHGMQAMLVLYMTGDLLIHPERVSKIIGFGVYRNAVEAMTGPLTDVALATQTFGFYLAFVTGLPLLGGWIGDKFTGRKIAVGAGAAMMTLGHFFMAFDVTFLFALLFLMTGAGMLRGNLSPQIKSLYADGDPRETNAFQYYYFSVNFGAFIAPIVSGAVAAFYGWHVGFGVAGIGMLTCPSPAMTVLPPFFTPRMVVPCQFSKVAFSEFTWDSKWERAAALASRAQSPALRPGPWD